MLHLAAELYGTEILTPITGTYQIILRISGQPLMLIIFTMMLLIKIGKCFCKRGFK